MEEEYVPLLLSPPVSAECGFTEFDNSSVGEEERFSARHVRDALLDWQVWMLSLINMSVITPGAPASLFAPCSS